MAVLPQAELNKIWRVFMRRKLAAGAYTKAQLLAAVTAADAWADANAAAFVAALPAAFRTNSSQGEKAALLALVALQRAGKLDDVS